MNYKIQRFQKIKSFPSQFLSKLNTDNTFKELTIKTSKR